MNAMSCVRVCVGPWSVVNGGGMCTKFRFNCRFWRIYQIYVPDVHEIEHLLYCPYGENWKEGKMDFLNFPFHPMLEIICLSDVAGMLFFYFLHDRLSLGHALFFCH